MNYCSCLDLCKECGRPRDSNGYRSVAPLTVPLVAELLHRDGEKETLPVVALGVALSGDVHLLVVDADGFVHEPGFMAEDVHIRERRSGEQLEENQG